MPDMEPVTQPTIYDVAKRAAVSTATVSRHVNKSGYVSERAARRIDAVAAELGFRSSTAARSLTTGRTMLVGFVVSELTNPFTVEVAQAVGDRAFEAGYSTLICGTNGESAKEAQSLALLQDHHVDGLIVTPPETEQGDAMLRRMHERGVPVVLLGRRLDPPGPDRVTTDTRGGEEQATRHLLDLGHERIAFAGGDRRMGIALGRLEGYLGALRAAGREPDEALIVPAGTDREGGAEALSALLGLADPPTALVTVNDEMALGAMQEARRRGLSAPGDISIVGFDDTVLAAHATPALTTVEQPKELLGRTAVEMIMARLEEPGRPPQEVCLACRLVVRESSGPRRGGGKTGSKKQTQREKEGVIR